MVGSPCHPNSAGLLARSSRCAVVRIATLHSPYTVGMVSHTAMCSQDALRFPLIGSAVLLGLFIVFKLFNKDLINALLTAYFVVRPGPERRDRSARQRCRT